MFGPRREPLEVYPFKDENRAMGHETLVWPLSLFGSRHAGVPLPVAGSEGDSGGKFDHLARDVKPAAPSSGRLASPSISDGYTMSSGDASLMPLAVFNL